MGNSSTCAGNMLCNCVKQVFIMYQHIYIDGLYIEK